MGVTAINNQHRGDTVFVRIAIFNNYFSSLKLSFLLHMIIGLIHVFEVVNIRRGPKNGLNCTES